MEKIDLTKCVNLRFRLRIDGTNYFGRIGTDERGRNCLFCDDGKAYWIADSSDELQRYGKSYLEIFPRDPETYRDWQVGDKVCEYEHRNACYEVIFRSGELVVFKDWNNQASNPMTCSEAFTRFGMRLVLTDIEQQIIEEKKKYEPQDGEICYVESKGGYRSIFVFRDGVFATGFYISYDEFEKDAGRLMMSGGHVIRDNNVAVLRPATDEEKQKLFDAMAKKGKRWNAEQKVVEDIPKPYEFRKGEPVLVRSYEFHRWIIATYVDKDKLGFIANAGVSLIHWKDCIPYNERTMHLLGTTEDYKEGE